MWWGIHEGMGWWMLFGGLWMLLFWGAIIALIVWGIRALAGWREPSRRQNTPEGDTPLEIARRRYARGEITREEFEDIRAALRD